MTSEQTFILAQIKVSSTFAVCKIQVKLDTNHIELENKTANCTLSESKQDENTRTPETNLHVTTQSDTNLVDRSSRQQPKLPPVCVHRT